MSFAMAHPLTSLSQTKKGTQGEGILSGLPSTLPDGTSYTRFTNMKDIQSLVDFQSTEYSAHLSSPFIVITKIPPFILQEFDRIYIDRGPRVTADFESRTLILETTMLYAHEIFSSWFDGTMLRKLQDADWISSMHPLRASRVQYGNLVKEPDASWAPKSLKTPTIVLEIGLSESKNHLAIVAQAWLEADGSKTNMVITVKISRRKPLIVLSKWEKIMSASRPMTRSYRNLMVASKTAEISIYHQDSRTKATGNLVISAEKMLGRPSSTGEAADITFTHQDLETMAEEAWETQGFI